MAFASRKHSRRRRAQDRAHIWERGVVQGPVIEAALTAAPDDETPVLWKSGDVHVLSPTGVQRVVSLPEVVRRDAGVHVVRDVYRYVVGQPVYPAREDAVHRASELRLTSVPLLTRFERDVRCRVVHESERTHPEMIPEPGHQPELDPAPCAAAQVPDEREAEGCEREDSREGNEDPRALFRREMKGIEMHL